MKYNELHRRLRKTGCYPTGDSRAGHPEWYSPITGRRFTTSNHEAQEVKNGTLRSILRDAGSVKEGAEPLPSQIRLRQVC